MSKLIKIEQDDMFSGKIDDDNNLKCGEIVFSNNTRFCFACILCQRVCGKVQDFFRHVLYDHLNYLDDYQLSDEDDYAVHNILETKPNTDRSMGDTEFIDVDLPVATAKIEKVDYIKHFEDFVSDDTPANYVKSELDDVEEEDMELTFSEVCDQLSKVKPSPSPSSTIQNDPQDILHIEILEAPSGSEYEDEDTLAPLSIDNTSEHHNPEENEDNHDFFENRDVFQAASVGEAENNANEDETATKENVYNCPYCKKVFVTKTGAKRHVANVHRQNSAHLTCEKCSKTFRSEGQLELHIKRHLGVKPYPCEICGTRFSDKSNLNVHILRHKGIKPHKCSLCEKHFHSTTERKLHMRSHTGERPFICEVCGSKFSNSGHLCSHRRRHLGEKRFKCDHCEKRFFDRKLLNDHKVMHTDERPFACDSCGATFQRKKALMQHEKLHSGIKQYLCKICGKTFAQNAGLYSHMKYH